MHGRRLQLPWQQNWQCNYSNMCRHKLIVYENTCKNTGKCYIGNTSQHYKQRMEKHNGQARLRLLNGDKYDSFAEHYAHQMQNFDPTKCRAFCGVLKHSYTSRILWQGKSISTVKTFQTNHCMLCNQERLHIFKRSMEDPKNQINFKNEIFGPCHHHPKFHRHTKPSTDDSGKEEKVTPIKVTTEV